MKQRHLRLITLFTILLLSSSTRADHILGGELLYKHLSGNSYSISLTLYGECSGGSFPHLKSAQPHINILNERGTFYTLILSEDINQRQEVTNVCPSEKNNTSCVNPTGTIPGATKFVYSAITQLEPAEQWRLLFAGHMDNSGKSQSGLSHYISNITNNTGFGVHLYLEATLNNAKQNNSSPVYTVDPTPFYCVNIQQQYNQGAVDTDKDELRFKLVPPVDINGIETKYVSPYSPTYPFSTQSNIVNYNERTGQMSFTPNKTEVVLVVNKVEEYRDNELMGSSMRAMTFFMRNNCNNQAPNGNIDQSTVQGGLLHENTIHLCDTNNMVSFSIPVSDNNNDNINVSLSNIPNGANVNVTGNNTISPEIIFNWDMHGVAAGLYTFYATYTDGVCPVPGKQIVAYSVYVAEPFSIFHEVLSPTNCKYKQFVQFHVEGGILPRKIDVRDNTGEIIASYTDNNYELKDSFATGSYRVKVYSENLPCSTDYNFEVTDYGTYPDPPEFEDIHHCLYETTIELNPSPAPEGVVNWYDINGNKLDNTPVYHTDSVQTYSWPVNQTVKVCPSVFDTFDVSIHPYPNIDIVNKGGHACIGDGMYLEATGGIRYEWQPADKIVYYNKKPFTYVYEPSTYIVTGYSEYECSTKDTLVFDDIEPCCLFTYPTAFTPNNDGHNDGWHPVTYGNVDFYLLSVYNRWGQRVFTSSDPKEKWNGRANGQPCELGTYHYLLRARCVTGKEELGKGDFVLLR